MRVLNFLLKTLVWVALIGGVAYVAYDRLVPCKAPVDYTLGAYDARFALSRADFRLAINEAAAIWNKAAGKQLFVYSSAGGMPINLVYDSRQAATQKNNSLKTAIGQQNDSADAVHAQYEAAQAQYTAARAAYESALADATPADYAALETERLQVNALAEQVNALAARYNAMVADINKTITTVNQTAGQEFEEGQYVQDALEAHIDIYEYSDHQKLVRVLAHELGHSLGLGHNTNPDSIMYPVNKSANMAPTKEDLADLKTVCRL